MYHFFAYLSRMKHIKRWGLMRNTEQENIKEHSLDVAMLAHGLAVIENTYFDGHLDELHIMALGMYHEASEVITGDLATPIKYFNPDIKAAYKSIENVANRKIISMLPKEMQPYYEGLVCHEHDADYSFVKYADKLCAYIKCVEEIKSGNSEFAKAKNKIAADIAAIERPCVRWFMENCMPSYELSLDELN